MSIAEMDNAALDRLVIRADRHKSYRGFPFKCFAEMQAAGAKRHIIKGVFARGETSAWIAPPGGMKSALMASASISVASGTDWFGKRNKERCAVVYFALERADLVERRLEAHKLRMNLPNLPIVLVRTTINLMKQETVAKVIATIREVEIEYGLSVGLVVFDTFAKLIAAGGGDEDKAKDQGAVFANVQRVKNEADVHVALVGHTGKDVERGARGSNAILGDADLMVTISGDTIKTATVTKANDAPEGPLFSFKSEMHEFGLDEDGDPITVNVVSTDDVEAQAAKVRDKWTKGLRLVRDCVDAALIDTGVDHTIPGGPVVRAVAVQAARKIHNARYVSNGEGDRSEAERKAWARNFKAAQEAGLIGGEAKNGQEWIWLL
ncbi:AAA family ATPase [Bradyrhizobium septentrionale]|uniref:AAA family ATPase n=1 Tax=Bradyrhizobium septentrionale TaxID=1404411 RepID=A0ABZ2NNZ6_9BRAD